MINKFQHYFGKLQWPLPVPIAKFVSILPIFVVSRAHATFAEVTESVKTFQELIEMDTVLHVFKNVTFSDVLVVHFAMNHTNLWIALLYAQS